LTSDLQRADLNRFDSQKALAIGSQFNILVPDCTSLHMTGLAGDSSPQLHPAGPVTLELDL